MEMNIRGDKIKVTDSMKNYITEKLSKLDKYLDIRNCATRKNMGYDYAIKLLLKYLEENRKYGKLEPRIGIECSERTRV